MGNKKLIYLIGAGASYNSLPLVKPVFGENQKVLKRGILDDFALTFDKFFRSHLQIFENDFKDFKVEVEAKVKKFHEEGKFFSTPDTYIKYLFGKDLTKAEEAKKLLSAYFFLKQGKPTLAEVPFDRRYLDFLVTLWSDGFPKDIGILSWNYDYQIEIASYYLKTNELESLQKVSFGFADSFKIYQNQTLGETGPTDRHTLVKLNGIGGFSLNDGSYFNHFTGDEKSPPGVCRSVEKILERDSSIKFAWENEYNSEFVKSLREYVKDTTILVVVGYSFPFFNRNIDKIIISEVVKRTDIKIYIQDPRANPDGFLSQFNLPPEFRPRPIQDTSSLYIPYEY